MPVEVSRKKALASSIERSELRITIQKIRMHSIKTADARLRVAVRVMRYYNSVPLTGAMPVMPPFRGCANH